MRKKKSIGLVRRVLSGHFVGFSLGLDVVTFFVRPGDGKFDGWQEFVAR